MMKALINRDNSDLFIITFQKKVLRCNLHIKQLDILNPCNTIHARALKKEEYIEMSDYDIETNFKRMYDLLKYLTVDIDEVNRIYNRRMGYRYLMLEAGTRLIEVDMELSGLCDVTDSLYARVAYLQGKRTSRVEFDKYLNVLKEIQRYADVPRQKVLFKN